MGSLKLVERFVRVDSGGFVGLGLANGGGYDIASLGAVALAANDLQLGLMAKVHRDAKIQIRNAFQPGLHVWGDIESNAHTDVARNPAVSIDRYRQSESGQYR